MYRYVDAVVVRAAAMDPGWPMCWPELGGPAATLGSWRKWLDQVWQDEPFAAAVTHASTDLARRVQQILHGQPVPETDVRRTVLAVLRYLLRARTRATPFGQFAGVAAARVGTAAALRVGAEHTATIRPQATWATPLVDQYEADERLRRHLLVQATNVAAERDGYLVLEYRRRGTGDFDHVRIRASAPVRTALEMARSPVEWSKLATQLYHRYPRASTTVIDNLLQGLVQQRVLLTDLRQPMTSPDPLAALHQYADLLPEAEAETIREPAVTVHDLCVDWQLELPANVAKEAAAAATALARLAPRTALAGWQDWHSRFLERYGPRAAVRVTDAIDALGYPHSYRDSPAPSPDPQPDRDARLIKMAHAAGMRRQREIVLADAALQELAAIDTGHPVQPSTELTVRVHSPSLAALDRGDFTLHVVGVSRSAGATTGRFLHLLDERDRRRMKAAYAAVPAVHRHALLAQVDCLPMTSRAENVARAPKAADLIISLGAHRAPDSDTVPLDDIAVTADADRLHLLSLKRRRPLHTMLLNAADLVQHTHPLARFLTEAPVALATPCTGFMWGNAASALPFLPALRYGRTLLSPARWHLAATDLPPATATWDTWDDALTRWRSDVDLPQYVYLSDADQALGLDLAEQAHRVLLRAHTNRHPTVTLHPAPTPEDLGWSGGRAHEVVVPLVADQDVAPVRSSGPVTGRAHEHLPACDGHIYLKLYGHPDRQDAILLRHLPPLLAELDSLGWWFVRYATPEHHLRLRIETAPDSLGASLESVGAWLQRLRHHRLISHADLSTDLPELGRYGGPYGTRAALEAAESYFAADSAAVLAQLAAQGGPDAPDGRAVTAASMVDITAGLLGDEPKAMNWLIENTRTTNTAPPRVVYRQAVDLVNSNRPPLDLRVTDAWERRRTTLSAYRRALLDASTSLALHDVLPSLLHLHHARVNGPHLAGEREHLHLARAAAVSWAARTHKRTP
ncbi:lantibiotic dehydratase [Streptomyces sp. BH055]|uniref:lantibiotic dehydratase n=1 Tax=Streptomyces sp. BH055 TaxID=3401173 RepID=UPI003BB6B7AF